MPDGRAGPRSSGPARWALAATVLTAGVWGGCGREEGPEEPPADRPSREIVPVVWDTVFRVGGSLQDTLFQRLARLAADAAGAYVVDDYAGRLHRFDRDGERLWSWGRSGRGPDELQEPRGLQVDRDGRAWILDTGNVRLTVVGRTGRTEARIPLDDVGARVEGFVPRADGALVLAFDPRRPVVRLDGKGDVRSRDAFPWPGFAELEPMATQTELGFDPVSGRWALAFAMGDGFFGFENGRWAGVRGWYVEPVAFPRVVVREQRTASGTRRETRLEDPEFGASSAMVDGSRLHVHFHGKTEHRGRLVDIYSLSDGKYLESLLLPAPVARLAYADSVYYGIIQNPYPELVAWRPRPRPTEAR